jgi:PAS domain S-box-containing protein
VVNDVTERKRAEAATSRSEDLYRTLVENIDLGISLVDSDYNIVMCNPKLSKLLDKPLSEHKGEKCYHVFEARQTVCPHCPATTAMATGEPAEVEIQEAKDDGTPVHVRVRAFPMFGSDRVATGFTEVVEDITERKQMEIALLESEKRLRLIIDSAPIGIRIVQNGKYVYVNPMFVQMFGYGTSGEIVGLPLETFYAPESKEMVLEKGLDRPVGTDKISHYEAMAVTKAGRHIDVAVWSNQTELFGKPTSLAFVMDVTESKSLRSQLLQAQKMEAIGTLAGGIAHDFNNLLTIILGYSELIISEKQPKDLGYEDLKKVIHAARSAADMIQQILAFSRKTDTKPRPVDLNNHVEQLRKMLSRLIPKTMEVKIDLDPDLPRVNADPAQIEQVLMNLAVNAKDAMPNGGRLTIGTKAIVLDDEYCACHIDARHGLHALLTISDTGVGIDKDSLDRIFEPFYTTKKPGEGTGLGLAMVYGIVKGHGGHITIYSEPGAGTTFNIHLPAHQVDTEPDLSTSAEFAAFGSGTILLADDEDLVRSLGQRILEKAGYRVLTACNGRQALEIYKQKRNEIALVVLDLIMPVMDGKQCLAEILDVNPGAKVLIASGYSPDGGTRDMLERGATGFVTKPYDVKHLIQAVREALL